MTGSKSQLWLPSRQKILWVFLFALGMAYLEAAVVVYLRMIFYPEGFAFPLVPGPQATILIELGREAGTILVLAAIAMLCGRTKLERFAYFILAFGIWDIMYYGWLMVQIGWPPSPLTWDLLFLIPVPWVSPVLAPILVSISFIGAALWIIYREDQGAALTFPRWAWWAEIFAGLIIILSFMWDVRNVALGGYPHPFRWDVFGIGLLGGIVLFVYFMLLPQSRESGSGG
jgi:hypothetical protein